MEQELVGGEGFALAVSGVFGGREKGTGMAELESLTDCADFEDFFFFAPQDLRNDLRSLAS